MDKFHLKRKPAAPYHRLTFVTQDRCFTFCHLGIFNFGYAEENFLLLSAQLYAMLILFCSAQASKALQGVLHPADWYFGIILTEQTICVVLGFLSLGSWQE